MTAVSNPNELQRSILLDGENYQLARHSDISAARQWKGKLISSQEADPGREAGIALDFVNGGGFTFQGLPGTYERANGWDSSSRGKLTTWPRFALGSDFTSEPSHGWMLELGGYLYVFRGRYVIKYEIDPTSGSTWAIVGRHDLGSGITLPGRPWRWRDQIFVPRIDSSGVLQRFHFLQTVAAQVTEQQTIAISGTPTGGTYTLTFDGKTTAGIAFDANAATVQAALRLIPGLEDVTVATTAGSSPNFTHTVTFTNAPAALGTASPPQLTSSVASLTGGTPAINHATTVAGTTDTWQQGAADRLARTFTVNHKGHLVCAMDVNEIRTLDGDPTDANDFAPNTAEGLVIGDDDLTINEMIQLLKYTMVLKEEGPQSFDEDFYSQPELPDLAAVQDADNGVGSSYSQGKILMPHRAGLVLWDLESYLIVGPNQEDGLEGSLTPGWGRVAASDVYGPATFVVVNDSYNNKAALWSLRPGGDTRPLAWHCHLVEDGFFEDVRVVSITGGSPVGAVDPQASTNANDNGGTIDWTDHANALSDDDAYAYAAEGTTKYLEATGPVPGVPDDATINGVIVRVKKQVA